MKFSLVADPARGDTARVTRVTLSLHAGTHVDSPNHLGPARRPAGGVERLSLNVLIGPALVLQAPRRRALTPGDLAALPRRAPRRLLLRGSPVILEETARELVRRGIELLGTDGLSIDPVGEETLPAHHVLLRAGVVILEGLRLARARPGRYHMIALPLLIPGADGAPARVVLLARGSAPGSGRGEGRSHGRRASSQSRK